MFFDALAQVIKRKLALTYVFFDTLAQVIALSYGGGNDNRCHFTAQHFNK